MSTRSPRVSVILNSFNQSAYLGQAVDSVLGQTFQDFELIAIDNGSTDGSQTVLGQYRDHPKVRLELSPDNVAVTRRFNQGVSLARGEFVSFLYSDDYYLPAKLERQIGVFARLSDEYGVVYGPGQGLNELTGRRWTCGSIGASGWVLRSLFRDYQRGQIDMISPLIRKTCLERYPFYEDVFAEGEAVMFRIALRYQFQFLNEPLAVLRDHASNAGKAIKTNADITMTTLDRLERHPDFPSDHLSDLHAYRTLLWRSFGWQSVRVNGDVTWGRTCFARAVRADWRQALHPKLLAGFGLSMLPPGVRRRINAWATARRGLPNNSLYVEDFGGSCPPFRG